MVPFLLFLFFQKEKAHFSYRFLLELLDLCPFKRLIRAIARARFFFLLFPGRQAYCPIFFFPFSSSSFLRIVILPLPFSP